MTFGATVHQRPVQFSRSISLTLQPWLLAISASVTITTFWAWSAMFTKSRCWHPTIWPPCPAYIRVWTYIYISDRIPCMIRIWSHKYWSSYYPIICITILQRYIGYSPRPSYHWPKKICTSERESSNFLMKKELFLKLYCFKNSLTACFYTLEQSAYLFSYFIPTSLLPWSYLWFGEIPSFW